MSNEPPDIVIREARVDDLPALIALFADDALGGHGDTTDPAEMPRYRSAFDRIAASPNDTLFVAEKKGAVVGTFQVSLITSLSGRGSAHLVVEAVQVSADMRGQGIGAEMIGFAVERAREAGARVVQLTSNASRVDAHRFYERLGFRRSHLGFKLKLGD